jgi:gamma-glutamyl hercynylcysteine S-oxide synthase
MIAKSSSPPQVTAPDPSTTEMLGALADARASTLALVSGLSDEQLERSHSPIMSPLVWDLAHIAAYEDLWLVHRHGGRSLLHPELAELYDAFETPRRRRASAPLLGGAAARRYLEQVRERTIDTTEHDGVGDGVLYEMVVRHELQHAETMRQTMALAGLLPPGEPVLAPLPLPGEQWFELPPGEFLMGAEEGRFSYDNERPRHRVSLDAFEIATVPLTNEQWTVFGEQGGYERREWWSPEGWRWRLEQSDAQLAPDGAEPAAAACHLSWFEADAIATAHGARLPSEAEWERAARFRGGCALQAVGQVWEWTSSFFSGYAGFVAHPYREYSEVFFGERYRVLRGGSWATNPRVASPTFRNWDLPQRRQLFAGARLARDAR